MVFAANQEQKESCNFKDILLKPDKTDFILAVIKEVEAHEPRSNWEPMTKSEVKFKHKNKYGKFKAIISIWYLKRKRLPY